jgi:prepilin-type processing-associated H-X9-DG protein
VTALGVEAPRPRHGLVGLVDQPTFDTKSLPPMPAKVKDFTVLSLDPKQLYDQVVALVKTVSPGSEGQIDAVVGAVRDVTGQRLREDLLGHLGPKMALYLIPDTTISPTNPYSGMLIPVVQFPKFTLLAEVDDAQAFGNVLDQLAAKANEALKQVVPPGQGGDDGETVRFRPVSGGAKGYVLEVPTWVLPLPTGLRPTIMVGKKYVALTVSPEVARQALAAESNPEARWKPSADVARALDQAPGKLVAFNIADPRDTIFPELLSNLPPIAQIAGSSMTGQPFRPPFGNPGAAQGGGFRLHFDPDKVPAPDELRKRLFPGWGALTVDDRGFRLVTREAFPSLNPSSAAPMASPVTVALLLPAVQSAREAARRAQCTNNLKQIALAFHNYHSANNKFPPAAIADKDDKPLLSWRVAILPYIEQQALYEQFHLDEPWDSPHNKALISMMPPTYACPTAKLQPGKTTYRVFKGKGAGFEGKDGLGLAEFTDGTSNTLLVVEAPEAVDWTKPDDLKFDPDPEKALPNLKSKVHPGGFNAAFCDGSVRFIKDSIDKMVLRALITRNGGEVINANDF